jgi:hypothetical protein
VHRVKMAATGIWKETVENSEEKEEEENKVTMKHRKTKKSSRMETKDDVNAYHQPLRKTSILTLTTPESVPAGCMSP